MHYADLVTVKATYNSVAMFHVQALINIMDLIRNHVYLQSCHIDIRTHKATLTFDERFVLALLFYPYGVCAN